MSEYPVDQEPLFFEADDSADGKTIPVGNDGEQLTILYTRALDLLSKCSRYVPADLKREIYCLADDTGRTTPMLVRVEWVGEVIVIDPCNTSG